MNKLFATIAVLTTTFSFAAQANYVGTQNDNTNIEVGESTVNGGPHVAGRAGIGIAAMGSTQQKVDFQALSAYAQPTNGIHSLSMGHASTGTFNFAKVGTSDVWFGEWSQDFNGNGNDRAVYYVGNNTNTTVPVSGIASYAVKGVNKFSGNNQLTGDFTADFGAQKLTGSLANSSLSLTVNANITSSTAAFNGTSLANGTSRGVATGHFFGADAASLAGIATFADRQLDTAFGGTKK